jgi:uncharacterized membrane protein YkoI
LEPALERKLKRAFICGSGSRADNGRVKAPCPPSLRRTTCTTALLMALLMALLGATLAPTANARDRHDHERARAAVQAGEVLPLPQLLDKLRTSHPGQVLELELEREDGRWIYEVKLLQPNGQLLKMEVDAATAQVLTVRRKGSDDARPREDRKPERPPRRNP